MFKLLAGKHLFLLKGLFSETIELYSKISTLQRKLLSSLQYGKKMFKVLSIRSNGWSVKFCVKGMKEEHERCSINKRWILQNQRYTTVRTWHLTQPTV